MMKVMMMMPKVAKKSGPKPSLVAMIEGFIWRPICPDFKQRRRHIEKQLRKLWDSDRGDDCVGCIMGIPTLVLVRFTWIICAPFKGGDGDADLCQWSFIQHEH